MDEEFIKAHWFQIGLLAIGAFLAWTAYSALVLQPEKARQAEALKAFEATEAAKKAETEKQSNLDSCLADASANYNTNWNGSCKSLGSLSARCEILTLDTTAGLFGTGYVKYKEWHPGATFAEYAKARDDCSCSLPSATAKRWDDALSNEKQECYQRYR